MGDIFAVHARTYDTRGFRDQRFTHLAVEADQRFVLTERGGESVLTIRARIEAGGDAFSGACIGLPRFATIVASAEGEHGARC